MVVQPPTGLLHRQSPRELALPTHSIPGGQDERGHQVGTELYKASDPALVAVVG